MLIVNDIVLIDEFRGGLSRKLGNCREALESKDFKIVAQK